MPFECMAICGVSLTHKCEVSGFPVFAYLFIFLFKQKKNASLRFSVRSATMHVLGWPWHGICFGRCGEFLGGLWGLARMISGDSIVFGGSNISLVWPVNEPCGALPMKTVQ